MRLHSTLILAALLLAACGPTDADRKSLQTGFADYSARRLDSAEAAADQYIRKNPTAPNLDEAYYLRGLARYAKGDKPAAAQDLQTAIAQSQRNDLRSKAWRTLGDMAFDTTQWQDAAEKYQKALAASPDPLTQSYCLYRTGVCLQNLGQWDNALPFIQQAVALNGDPQITPRAVARLPVHNFALQFGAFQEPPKAGELIAQLKTAAIAASATTELREGKLLYLVRSGSYRTWEDASQARARLLSRFPLVTIVP